MIDYRLLQALAAVIEQQGFEKAALQLCLTQSAVSRRIKQLEALLGQPVLLRTSPPVATAAGQPEATAATVEEEEEEEGGGGDDDGFRWMGGRNNQPKVSLSDGI